MRSSIAALVGAISPADELERRHLAAAAAWIASDAPLCRTRKPDTPPQHLVSYCVLVDPDHRQLLLADHRLAGLWLPTGGHVEPDEHPATTALREAAEELAITPALLQPEPLFLTVTATVGTPSHTDVSLWYLLRGSAATPLDFDRREFHAVRWFDVDALPLERADPHLGRFAAKLRAVLAR